MTSIDQNALATLVAKDEIRQLALLYSRGVDRKDAALLRTLYTRDGTDNHGKYFNGTAPDYVAFLERAFAGNFVGGHFVCNHLIEVNGDDAEGEVYALAYHLIPNGKGEIVEDLMGVRYIDRYRKEDGRWRFARRVVAFDFRNAHPLATPQEANPPPEKDLSYANLAFKLFARGKRA